MISVQFSVPILKLDLKNEHNVSLVHLSFQEFSFKDVTVAEKQQEIHVLLRSVIMEDLKCPTTSKYRNMVNSSSDVYEQTHFLRNQMSSSCPDLSQTKNQNISKTLGSIPTNLNKITNCGSFIKNCNITCLKKIEGVQLSQKGCTENLVIYRSCIKKSMDNAAKDTIKSSLDFNCLNLIISIEKWFMVFDFFGLISNHADKEEELSNRLLQNGKYIIKLQFI